MDWNDLAKAVGPILAQNAPTIGGVLGGLIPIPGGSLIGSAMGGLLANVFGVPNDPASVQNAIINDPNAAIKITAAEQKAIAKWPALAQIAQANAQANSAESESINQTMRAELASGQVWWSWRNLYGYSVGIECTVTSWIIFYALVWDPKIFKSVSDSFSFFLSWYGLRMGLLGYIHNGASNEKIAAVTGESPSIVKNIIKAVKGR